MGHDGFMADVIKWVNNRSPDVAVAEFLAVVPEITVRNYLRYLKATAAGSVRQNGGNRWPVDSGFSRDRFAMGGRLNRGEQRPPERILILGARYARYPNRLVRPDIMTRVWRSFDVQPSFDQALSMTRGAGFL